MRAIFLTSDLGSYKKINGVATTCEVDNRNNLVNQLNESIEKRENFVFVASNPSGYSRTDSYAKTMFDSFKMSGVGFERMIVLDDRTKKSAKEIIKNADLVFLAGGYVPSQNDFIKEINLGNLLQESNAVVMGQSAGSMNLAKTVYNYPEEASEINDPKFLTGLGLTNISVIPHFNIETGNDQVDDDIDFMNDYLKKDSFILPLYCITNASHIKIEGDLVESYGEVYMVKNGIITQLENAGQIIIDENE